MMSCTQASAFLPHLVLGGPCRRGKNSLFQRLACCSLSKYRNFDPIGLGKGNLKNGNDAFPRLVCRASKNGRINPVCLASGNSKGGNKGFSWESLKNAMGDLKQEESVQGWLKKQKRENEFDGDGGDEDCPGAGGGGDGSGGEEDEDISCILDELLQVIFGNFWLHFCGNYKISSLTNLHLFIISYSYYNAMLGCLPLNSILMCIILRNQKVQP